MTVLLFIASFLPLLFLGMAFLLLMRIYMQDSLLFMFMSLISGVALNAFWMTLLGVFSLPWILSLILFPIILPSVYIVYKKKNQIPVHFNKEQIHFFYLSTPLILLMAVRSLSGTVTHWDFMLHWAAKAKHYYLQQAFDTQYIKWPLHFTLHPDYPHLVTNIYSYQALCMGEFNDRLMMLNDVIFSTALFYIIFRVIQNLGAKRFLRLSIYMSFIMLFTAFVVNTRTVGGADILFTTFLAYILFLMEDYFSSVRLANLSLVMMFLAFLSFTKYEGLFYTIILVIIMLGRMIKKKQRISSIVFPFLAYLFFLAPWFTVTAMCDLQTHARTNLTEQLSFEKLMMVPSLLTEICQVALQNSWYGIWIFFAFVYLYLMVTKKKIWYFPVIVSLSLTYMAIYLANKDPVFYLQSSFARLLLPVFILCMFDFINGFRFNRADRNGHKNETLNVEPNGGL